MQEQCCPSFVWYSCTARGRLYNSDSRVYGQTSRNDERGGGHTPVGPRSFLGVRGSQSTTNSSPAPQQTPISFLSSRRPSEPPALRSRPRDSVNASQDNSRNSSCGPMGGDHPCQDLRGKTKRYISVWLFTHCSLRRRLFPPARRLYIGPSRCDDALCNTNSRHRPAGITAGKETPLTRTSRLSIEISRVVAQLFVAERLSVRGCQLYPDRKHHLPHVRNN